MHTNARSQYHSARVRPSLDRAIVGRVDDDRHAILSRRRLLIAGALSGAALASGSSAFAQGPEPCLSAPVRPPPAPFSREPGRIQTPIERIPEEIHRHLWPEGIYAAGGGSASAPWRISLSLAGLLEAAESDERGARATGVLQRQWFVHVPAAAMREIVALADRTWRELRPQPRHPSTSYSEVLAIRDHRAAYFFDGRGAIRGGAAEALIARVRETANAQRPR